MLRRSAFLALLLAAAAPPLTAQQSASPSLSAAAMDFWVATGRFYGTVGAAARGDDAKPLADLAGTYQVEGKIGERAYTATLDFKRWKTFTAPSGGKFDAYQATYKWAEGTLKGVAMLIGNRFYLAYGSENLALFVAAPLVLTDDERTVFAKYRDVRRQVDAENAKRRNSNTVSSVKGTPWFSNLYTGDLAQTYPDPAYYTLWVGAWGGYGHYFATPMPKFAEGKYRMSGDFLKENGEEDRVNSDVWEVSRIGENLKVVQVNDARDRAKDVDGTAMPLEDGTVVMMLGGNNDCWFGYYDVKNNTLTGRYAGQYGEIRGVETLTPSAAILSKNAKFFAR